MSQRFCAVCGCVENDACVNHEHEPCSWILIDQDSDLGLCSACAPDPVESGDYELEVERTFKVASLRRRLDVALGRAAAIVDTEIRVGLASKAVGKFEDGLNRKQRRTLDSKRRRIIVPK